MINIFILEDEILRITNRQYNLIDQKGVKTPGIFSSHEADAKIISQKFTVPSTVFSLISRLREKNRKDWILLRNS